MFAKYVEVWDGSYYRNSIISYDKSRGKHTGKQASILETEVPYEILIVYHNYKLMNS